jgi:hypothetical protein
LREIADEKLREQPPITRNGGRRADSVCATGQAVDQGRNYRAGINRRRAALEENARSRNTPETLR